MSWCLKRTKQCSKCPWREDVDPNNIPNGYDVDKHKALEKTIAEPGDISNLDEPLIVMACHETHDSHCIGWLHNQIGPGNNIPLRIKMLSCTNGQKIKVIGEQHQNFEDTIPKEK